MPLNQFITRQPSRKAVSPASDVVSAPTYREPSNGVAKTGEISTDETRVTIRQVLTRPVTQAQTSPRKSLLREEQQTLCALSAMQIKYGQPAEAIPHLMMIRKTNPENAEASRLLALSLMKLKRWEQAQTVLDELKDHDAADRSGGMLHLYRSLVALKTRKIAEARIWFARFRAVIAGSAS